MKKYINLALAAASAFALVLSCAKEENFVNPEEATTTQTGTQVSISASLDALTKVSFDPTYTSGKPTALTLTWSAGDQIRVYNHDDRTQYEDFTLEAASIGKKKGSFVGNSISAASYDIEVINGAFDYADQTQPSDGVTSDLKYMASVEDVADYTDIDFTDFNSTLAITVKMPSTEVAAAIKSVDITASDDIFDGGNTLSITFDSVGDADDDGILHFFATLPQGDQDIDAGTWLIVHFNAPGTAHTVYTRYIVLPATTFTNNKLNTININASQSDTHAGLTSCDGSNAASAYLIGDKYQLLAVASELSAGATRYFKMIDDVDMDGVTWTPLNPDPFTKAVNFNGNSKTISNLNASLFNDLNGTVTNLTIEDATVNGGSAITGILANTIKTAASTVTNVDVTNSSVTATGYTGGLIGEIDDVGGAIMLTMSLCDVSHTSVSGSLAGGVVGFANASISMMGCTFDDNGTVTASARYCGGMLGSTGNYYSEISDCHVPSASITSSSDRAGGFVGQLQAKVQIKGCSVGTPSSRVSISSTKTSGVANVGGFVGVNYGTITQNIATRNDAYVTISSSNETGNRQMNIGGFAGYNTGRIEYSNVDISASTIKGSHIGGFAGIVLESSVMDNCSATGTISGTQKTGGFVGVAQQGSISNSSASTVVSKLGTTTGTGEGCDFGGFVGEVTQTVTITKCYADGNITINASYVGGFAGSVNPASSKTATIQKCWSTGVVTSSSSQCGGFIGHIAADAAGTVTVSDCYETGNLVETNQRQGGLIGQINSGNVTVSRCYAAGTVAGSFGIGGLVGFMNSTATVEDCVAWNTSVTPSSYEDEKWSSGAIIGVAWPIATIINNYRKPGMSLTAWWIPAADYQHPDVESSTHPLVVRQKADASTLYETSATSAAKGQDNYPLYAYHGKVESGKTLSQLASSTLGWSSETWDFTGDLPTLR